MAAETWDRIEPACFSEELEPGLRAELADPLWLLTRQLQFGEFAGDDAASPLQVRLTARTHRLQRFRAHDAQRSAPLPAGAPLEAVVEAEAAEAAPSVGLRIQAALDFERRLADAGLGALTAALRRAYPIAIDESGWDAPSARARRRLTLYRRRAADGLAALDDPPARLARKLGARPAQRAALKRVRDQTRQAWRAAIQAPPEGQSSWRSERLEHAFSLRATVGSRDVALNADQYPGGRLDWFDFDLDENAGRASRRDPGETLEIRTLAAPVRFAGMPAERWWEFEEGRVRFGDFSAGPADPVRLVVAEFATVFSEDWRLLSVRLPVGSLTRIETLEALDTFGRTQRIRSTALQDYRRRGDERAWRLFELTGDRSVENDRDPWLFLAPALPASPHSEPIEKTTFLRDEAANLAWAIEEIVQDPGGRPYARRRSPETETAGAPASADPNQLWNYRLATPVPPNWIPLIPERIGTGPDMRLRRARMEAWSQTAPGAAGPRGVLLDRNRPLRLFEEEIPRGGLEVTRSWQWARSADGGTHLWIGRRKRPGRGERGAGLQADGIETTREPDA